MYNFDNLFSTIRYQMRKLNLGPVLSYTSLNRRKSEKKDHDLSDESSRECATYAITG